MRILLLAGVLALSRLQQATASMGDRAPAYERCTQACTKACPPSRAWIELWPCSAECSYACMTNLTELALSYPWPKSAEERHAVAHLMEPDGPLEGLLVGEQVQFHGKWPFVRFLGMQEIASVVFSLLNLYSHAVGLAALSRLRTRSRPTATLKNDYIINAWVGINTWVWSAVFHTRDVDWTERADYFSAAASTLYGLWLSLDRVGGLYDTSSLQRGSRQLIRLVLFAVFLSHVAYLSRGRFDYGYNMTFNVVVGVTQILVWTSWSLAPFFATSSTPKPPHHLRPLLPAFALLTLAGLEMLEFDPVPYNWRLIDAHALWHASTIFVVRWWYLFLAEDLKWVDAVTEDEKRDV